MKPRWGKGSCGTFPQGGRFTITLGFEMVPLGVENDQEDSFRKPSDHFQNPIRHAFELGIDLGERTWRGEDVEVAVEGDFVADLGFLVIDPRVRCMGQNFTLEVSSHILGERDVFRIAPSVSGC